MIFYFTGTGNSRYCALLLARRLEDRAEDAFPYLRRGAAPELSSQKPWVFVCPTYAWRIPRVFEELIRGSRLEESREAYFVMTCGAEIGAPQKRLRALCREKGLAFRGVLQVVMPENYIAMFNAPEAPEARRIVAAAQPVLEAGAAAIREGRDLPGLPAGLADRVKSGPVNPLFYRFCVKAGPFRAGGGCTGCGRCRDLCPLGNIRLGEGRPVWGDRCTHCMACICGCPAEAIEYGKASLGKPRYRCPSLPEDL